MCQVPESHIILINLFCTPTAASRIVAENPNVRFLLNFFPDLGGKLKVLTSTDQVIISGVIIIGVVVVVVVVIDVVVDVVLVVIVGVVIFILFILSLADQGAPDDN